MNSVFPDMKNPWVRRPLIVLIVTCAIPFLALVFVAEVIWETAKAMVNIVKEQIADAAPTIKAFAQQIKDAW